MATNQKQKDGNEGWDPDTPHLAEEEGSLDEK